jgi:tRNA(fMet)-specific endonuclease VapC
MACLDTTVLVDLQGGRSKTTREVAERKVNAILSSGQLVVITRFTLAELFVGVQLHYDPLEAERKVNDISGRFPVLEFTSDAAFAFGEIVAACRKLGKPIQPMDALIAATAIVSGEYLVTRNAKDFVHVQGLRVETY